MNRRRFVKTVALAPWAASWAQGSAFPRPDPGAAGFLDLSDARGLLGDRFALTLERVLSGEGPAYTEEFVLADVRPTAERRFTEFSGDVSGRYIGALATVARLQGMDFPQLDALVHKLIAFQKPDGYFGSSFHFDQPNDGDMALLWGNGRLLVGLLEYEQWHRSDAVLAACRRIGDFLLRIGPMMLSRQMRDAFGAQHFASSYICWTQQTEGLANLYRVSRDVRYRTLAEQIAATIERRAGDHVHGYLTSLRGVMDLYAITGDQTLLRQCETRWQQIVASADLLITGGVPEGWSPNNHRTEGCGEADWIRFNLSLWTATADEKYLSMAERAIFNEFAFNQFASGDFGHRVYSQTGLAAAGAVRAWWCCTLHGLRCFPAIGAGVFRADPNGLHYDLPLDGRAESPTLSASAASALNQDGSATITITEAGSQPCVLSIRLPIWAESVEILPSDLRQSATTNSQGLSVRRVWRRGDVVRVQYRMRLEPKPEGESRFSYWFGPWLLGASAADNPMYFNELTAENKLTGTGLPAAENSPRRFAVPVAATEFRSVPAEFPDQPLNVNLRAIAEQTGEPSTGWELRLRHEAGTPA
jgi:DUF1680 family protein